MISVETGHASSDRICDRDAYPRHGKGALSHLGLVI